MRLLKITHFGAGLKGRYAELRVGQVIEQDRLEAAGHDVLALLSSGAVVPVDADGAPVKAALKPDAPQESTPLPTAPPRPKTVPETALMDLVGYAPAVALARAGYDTVEIARAAPIADLLKLKGVGQISLDKLHNVPEEARGGD